MRKNTSPPSTEYINPTASGLADMADSACLQDTLPESRKDPSCVSKDPPGQKFERQSAVLLAWLRANVPEFQRLSDLRAEVIPSTTNPAQRLLTHLGLEQSARRQILPEAAPQRRPRQQEDVAILLQHDERDWPGDAPGNQSVRGSEVGSG
jgi:hypothetical protein